MIDFSRKLPRRVRVLFLMLAITAAVLTSCSGENDDGPTTEQTPAPLITEQTTPVAEPITEEYPFSFILDDGTEISITLPYDPEYDSEMHLCSLSDTDTLAHVLIHNVPSDGGIQPEEIRVFSGEDGHEYSVTTVNEVLSRYVTIYSEDTDWRMAVNGADYMIPKAQFSDDPSVSLLENPDPTRKQDFFVENGQLFCRVSFLCTAAEDGYADETLKIRFDIVDGAVSAAEITFERPQSEETAAP